MKVLFERTASPKEIAFELGEPLNNVTYHIKRLLSLECIELVEVRPARGGRVVQHFYRATRRALFDNEAWAQFGVKEKTDVTMAIMRIASEDVTVAMEEGTFDDPDDSHISRSPMVLDREGWGEVNTLLDETMERLFGIQDRVLNRRESANWDDDALHTKVHLIHFRSPPPKSPNKD
jgi:hypothetical protein